MRTLLRLAAPVLVLTSLSFPLRGSDAEAKFGVANGSTHSTAPATGLLDRTRMGDWTAFAVADLRCDGGVNPLGVDSAPPRLSWKLRMSPAVDAVMQALDPAVAAHALRQSSYRILVASSAELLAREEGDVWDSGEVSSDAQLEIPFAGRALRSAETVFWKVRVQDGLGRPSKWSEPATWTMGALDWKAWSGAKWITDPELLRWHRSVLGTRTSNAPTPEEPRWLQLDLGSVQRIDSMTLQGVRHTVDEFTGLPLRYKVEVATQPDFSDATVFADHTAKDYPNAWTTRMELKRAAGAEPVSGRYLRLTSAKLRNVNGVICLALSQWVVTSAGKNIAPGAKVTGSDLVENAIWSRTALVDGLGAPGANPRANMPLYLRREFSVKPGLRRALAHVSGLGHYELSVNGVRATPGLLTPGWTAYTSTILYDTIDLSAQLTPGANALGLVLAGGMYNVQTGRYVKFVTPFRPLTALVALRLEYADGTVETVVTDEHWRASIGPLTYANMFGGEDYDATQAAPGWDRAGFDDRAWIETTAHAGPGGKLRGWSHASPPFAAFETFTPVAQKEIRPGVVVYDFGQNAAVQLKLRVRGPRAAKVKLIPGELVDANGAVERRSSGGNDVWWHYTLAGDPAGETWEPRFFYQGCRYLQVELSTPETGALPAIESIATVVTHSASPPAGEFESSDPLFNRIRTLIRWAQRSNSAHVLTDCPHRERLGWLEQYHLNGPALRYEADLARLYLKVFNDMKSAQTPEGLIPSVVPEYVRFADGFRDSPEWGASVILAAWQHYVWTGDDTPFRRNYGVMQQYLAYLETKAKDGLLVHGLGDWYDLGPNRPGVAQLTPIAVTATAIWIECAQRMGDIAERLGNIADARRYRGLAGKIDSRFNREFFHEDSGTYASGSQTAQAMPLVLGIVPDHERKRVLAALVRDLEQRGHAITAGDVGYRYVLRALAAAGRSDVIFAMNNQTTKPGYGFQLAQGATSLTEAWDADRRSSQNHFMLGQLTEWFYADLAGLAPDPTRPGFRRVLVAPQPVAGIDWAKASHESPYGPVSVSWRRAGGVFKLEVHTPPGSGALVAMPYGDANHVQLNGAPIAGHAAVQMRTEFQGKPAFIVGAGSFEFTAPLAP